MPTNRMFPRLTALVVGSALILPPMAAQLGESPLPPSSAPQMQEAPPVQDMAVKDMAANAQGPHPAPLSFADLKLALTAVSARDYTAAMTAAALLSPLEKDVVLWVAIRRGLPDIPPETITDFAQRNPHWPTGELMRRRAEQALIRGNRKAEDITAIFAATPPASTEGKRALARAYRDLGKTAEARAVLAPLWTGELLSLAEQSALLEDFGDILVKEDHLNRYRLLMYRDRFAEAMPIAKILGKDYEELISARAGVLRGEAGAGKRLDGLAKTLGTDPLYIYTAAEWHRRSGRHGEAAKLLLSVNSSDTETHADDWWIERRIVSRDLIERGQAALAYDLVKAHDGGNAETRAEALFHAGWYALRFLKDPAKAEPHFKALQASVSLPISRARAAYWLGRTAEAAGDIKAARAHFEVAATDEQTFYGQLARVKLGMPGLDMPEIPEPSAEDRAAFARNDLVRAMVLLLETGYAGDAALIYPELSRHLPSGGQVAILAEFLEQRGDHRAALQVGKIAADRGLGVERLAFPLGGIPPEGRNQTQVETAMIYAIARQESAFDHAAVSHAGALGLLQLLPTTAAATAEKIGVGYSTPQLTSDPAYNATLGAAHLRELVDAFGGSYILTFAAYNAGKRRAYQWIERFGDPRDPDIDPVDWIEQIPFGETRNYVQRVTENLQVYRARLGVEGFGLAEDLLRGSRPSQ